MKANPVVVFESINEPKILRHQSHQLLRCNSNVVVLNMGYNSINTFQLVDALKHSLKLLSIFCIFIPDTSVSRF